MSTDEPQPLFADLGLSEPLLRAIDEMGYRHPTPIQAQAIPVVLMGRDVMGVAQTGTGKTASFTLPMLDILSGSRARARMPRSLILEPTRELALQVAENFVQYGKHLKLNHALLIGGESMADQRDALMRGVDVLIATPGRLLDLFERGGLLLTQTSILVIDEADRMLDMGFIPDVERIVSLLSPNRQTLFFSATMAPEIRRLSEAFLSNPKVITVARQSSVATTIETGLVLVAEEDKRRALRAMLRAEDVSNALIFCNRKRDVDTLLKSLLKHGFKAGALHGDLPQSVRFATLEKFKAGELQLLVCSDVAARGIDIGGLSHVFNFDVPMHAEDYVHRIGRTGRAGRSGHAYTLASPYDRLAVAAIEKLTDKTIPPITLDGIETAEWSEDDVGRGRGRDGKRGRGRDGHKGGKDAPRGGKEPRREAQAVPQAPDAAPVAESAQPVAEPRPRREPKPETRREPRAERGPSRDGRRDAPRPERSEQRHDQRSEQRHDQRSEQRHDQRGEQRHDQRRGRHNDDLGPAEIGFGAEIPAFMLLPMRRDRVARAEPAQRYPDLLEGETDAVIVREIPIADAPVPDLPPDLPFDDGM